MGGLLLRQLQLFILLFVLGCSTPTHRDSSVAVSPPNTKAAQKPSPFVELNHTYFVVAYDPEYKLARFVRYSLTADQLKVKRARRRDKFVADPLLVARGLPHITAQAYKRSGYDRGHLAPSEDFVFDQAANDKTFVMSNMVPQKPALNRGAWNRLEAKVRRWACGEEKVTIITGPLLEPNLQRLPSGVPIPRQFFKIVVDETPPRKVAAFLYQQDEADQDHSNNAVSLAELERKASYDLVADFDEASERQPAQLNAWKEKDCR